MKFLKTFESITGQDMSSIDRMKMKYPKGIEFPKEIKATGSGNFETGIDSLDTKSKKFFDIIELINDLLLNTTGKVKVVVNSGASAVGVRGYDNQALADRRRDKTIEALKAYPFVDKSRIEFIKGTSVVGKATVKDSPEAEKEQFVSILVSGTGSMREPITGVEGDNTNVYRPEIFRDDLVKKFKIEDIDTVKIIIVCLQMPEQYVELFKKAVWEFKNANNIKNLPLGVYELKSKK